MKEGALWSPTALVKSHRAQDRHEGTREIEMSLRNSKSDTRLHGGMHLT
jgi:hypothetical protein